MNIAISTPLYIPTSINSLGGGEVWTASYALNLANKNHKIDLYTHKKSSVIHNNINQIPITEKGINEIGTSQFLNTYKHPEIEIQKILYAIHAQVMLQIVRNMNKYNLVIDSSGKFLMSYNWNNTYKPLIVIGHTPVTHIYVKLYSYMPLPTNVFFVFPSQFQFNQASWIDTSNKFYIPHGIDVDNIALQNNENKNNLVWVGRIDPNSPKGLTTAMQLANKMGLHIDIFGSKVNDNYFNSTIEPLIKTNCTINLQFTDKFTTYKDSKIALFPLEWDEPFGLVMVESMASGTPVIAYARGAVPEIIKDGETGFIVNSSDNDIRGNWIIKKTGIEGLKEAIEKIYAMPENEYRVMRKACRAHVEKNFTIERMVNDYEKLFQQILSNNS